MSRPTIPRRRFPPRVVALALVLAAGYYLIAGTLLPYTTELARVDRVVTSTDCASFISTPNNGGTNKKRLLIVLAVGDSPSSSYATYIPPRKSPNGEDARASALTLVLVYYGDDENSARRHEAYADIFVRKRGLKYALLSEVLGELSVNWDDYDFAWFPDDDLRPRLGMDYLPAFSRILREEACGRTGSRLVVAQPALELSSESGMRASHNVTLVSPLGCRFRYTNFVEIQMPAMRVDFLLGYVLPLLSHTAPETNTAWGLDFALTRVLGNRYPTSMAVLDAVPMVHLRAPSAAYDDDTVRSTEAELAWYRKRFLLGWWGYPPHKVYECAR